MHNFVQDNYGSGLNSFGSSKHNQNNIQLTPQANPLENPNCFSFFNSKLTADKNSLNSKLKVNISGNHAIAAAASQAIAATQQMQLGRRSASLKASYEAINSGFPNFNLNSMRMDDSDGLSELNDAEKSNKKSRMNKRSRTSSQYNLE